MIIATLKECTPESRVAITPTSTKNLVTSGFEVVIEQDAGLLSGFSNRNY